MEVEQMETADKISIVKSGLSDAMNGIDAPSLAISDDHVADQEHDNYLEYRSQLERSKSTAAVLRKQLQLQQENLKRLQADAKELARDKTTFDLMFDHAPIGCLVVDRLQNILRINPVGMRLLGDPAAGHALLPMLVEPEYRRPLAQRIDYATRGSGGKLPARLLQPGRSEGDEPVTDVILHIEPMRDNQCEKVACHITIQEVEKYDAAENELRKARDYLQQLASHDELTGLPNRRKFREDLSKAIADAQKCDCALAVILIDLNRFKEINDSLGHEYGDNLLIETARRLERSTQNHAGASLARLGGDEFAVVLPEIHDTDIAVNMCEDLASSLSNPYLLGSQQIESSASFGVSMFPVDADNYRELLQFADSAMYRAKRSRYSNNEAICFFNAGMKRKIKRREHLERDLRATDASHEMSVWYQPIVAINPITTRLRVVDIEALVRWTHPTMGLVKPEEFVEIAQDCGTIQKLGFHVIEESLRTLARVQSLGLNEPGICINVTASQLTDPEFSTNLLTALYANDLRPRQLTLEISESAILDSCKYSSTALSDIALSGIKLSIDDFGTGYSSFSHLRQLHINRIKIARAFINKVPADSDDCSIVTAITSIARDLEIEVGAIGVEHEEQVRFLTDAGCTTFQGYLLSRPVPAKCLQNCLQRIESTHLRLSAS
jgi:diguanylate cyclase (GGDEF)-like protein